MARHCEPSGPPIQQRGDGRWILVSERKTDDGSTVAVYSDITELKQRENQAGEQTHGRVTRDRLSALDRASTPGPEEEATDPPRTARPKTR